MTHVLHQTKFRWTENLTSRFIQLRKENGNLFTGRKYSAQAGWEHILQQMRQEFPTIMADVHYRVLKKKWSNLLQQYKELKNPVHGDKNKSDDVSWPFYGAIDEVLGYGQRNDNDDDDDLNPHEFLCLSVTPEEPGSPEEEQRSNLDADLHDHRSPVTAVKRMRNFNDDFSIEIERLPRIPIRRPRLSSRHSQISQELRNQDASEVLVSRLPPATELSIKTVRSSSSSVPGLRVRKFSNNTKKEEEDEEEEEEDDDSPRQFLRNALALTSNNKRNGNHTVCNYNQVVMNEVEDDEEEVIEDEEEEEEEEDDEVKERPRKLIRRLEPPSARITNSHECGKLEKRLNEFLEYTKRRDEENRIIMTRILNAVEKIAGKE